MKNPNIGALLKYYRKLNQLSVTEVAEILKTYDIVISTKSIYAWENSQTQPNADTFMLLCEIYHIDNVLEIFGYRDPGTTLCLNDREKEMICQYRNHPEMHKAIHKLLNMSDEQTLEKE